MSAAPRQILCAIFFVSGAAALVFETLWFRQARLAFGNSVWASTLVLSSFMAGLALGNALAARFGNRVRRPVRLYALLEACVAVTGVTLVLGLPVLGRWLAELLGPLLDRPWALNPLRLGLAFACLLVPATAMGATLPVLVRALHERDPNFGSVLGRLYGYNTLGAVIGALVGELFLLEWFGIRGTGACAAALYGSAAVAALFLARHIDRPEAHPSLDTSAPEASVGRPGRAWSLVSAAFLAGGILLAFEVVWFRFLLLFVNPSSLTFALMLSVLLSGIGVGGWTAGAWLRRRPADFGQASLLAFLAGATAALLYAGFSWVFVRYGGDFITNPLDILWLTACLTLPVAILSGVLFTFTGTALHREVQPEIRATGLLTFANTVGGGLGAVVGGLVLLPMLGMERSIFLLSALYAVLGALLLVARSAGGRGIWIPVGGVAALAVVLAQFPFGSMQEEHMRVALRRQGRGQTRIAAVREGRSETILYLRTDFRGEPLFHHLVTNSFGMAASHVMARRYMKLFVYWPIALHPSAERALLISYGIGSTAKALTDSTNLRRIDIVDPSREVLEMNEVVYPDPSENPLRDPRVRIHIEDGRYFLQTSRMGYDLITSEPPPPKHAGIENLYTREYFELIHDRLNEGGISTYWLPLHTLVASEAKAIIRAYCEVFRDCSLWNGVGSSWMLVGSREARWSRSEAALAAQWNDPVVVQELRNVGLELPEQLGALFLGDAAWLEQLTRGTLPLLDEFPKRLTDRWPDESDWKLYDEWMDPVAARERFEKSEFIAGAWPEALRKRSLEFFEYQGIINDLAQGRESRIDTNERFRLLYDVITSTPLRTLSLWLLGVRGDQLEAIDRLLARGDPEEPHLTTLGDRALAARDFPKAATYYERAQKRPRRPAARRALAQRQVLALCLAGERAAAEKVARAARTRLPADPSDGAFWSWIADSCGLQLAARATPNAPPPGAHRRP